VFINGFPAGKATIGSGLSVDLASSTAIPVSQGQVATATLMGNNSGVSNLPFALSATASLTLLGIPGLQTSGITGNLTLSKTGTTARTQTARDASGNLCLDTVDNNFATIQTIDLSSGTLPAMVNPAATSLRIADGRVQEFISFANTGQLRIARCADGTRAVPTAVPNGRGFIVDQVNGYDGSAWVIGPNVYGVFADGLWTATNRGTYTAFSGIPNGSTTGAECMRLQNGCQTLGGIAAVSGNGLIQLASGTTKANGIAFGDWIVHRVGATDFNFSPAAATDGYVRVVRSSGETLALGAASGVCVVRAASAHPLWIGANGGTAITIDTSQGVTTAAANYVKVRSVAASAGTTTLNGTDDTAILTGAAIHTFTLPAAANGRRLFIKNRSSLALTVNRAGADTIDGLTTIAVATGTAKILIANGTDWCVWNA
jgi:hypothetical protein